jgi:hypothetical protein
VPVYAVKVAVEGIVNVVVEAANEDDACREARRLAELGEGVPDMTHEAVNVEEVRP